MIEEAVGKIKEVIQEQTQDDEAQLLKAAAEAGLHDGDGPADVVEVDNG